MSPTGSNPYYFTRIKYPYYLRKCRVVRFYVDVWRNELGGINVVRVVLIDAGSDNYNYFALKAFYYL